MPHLTTCAKCHRAYEESSEERANEPAWLGTRLCPECYAKRPHMLVTWHDGEDGGPRTATVRTLRVLPEDAALARRLGLDPARVTYDPYGEAWFAGAPLWAYGDGEVTA